MSLKKILIADDNAEWVESLARHLRRDDVEVKTAYDALTLLKLVHLDAPDALCLGINMPCDNGVCVCELLAAEGRFRALPIVLLTDRADDWLTHDCHGLRAVYTAKAGDAASRVERLLAEITTDEPIAAFC